MARKKSTPKQFSAYVVIASTNDAMPVESVLIDKGSQVVREWNVMNFETGAESGAVGQRLTRLCATCRVEHNMTGVLGHDGECGSDDVRQEARQEMAGAKKCVLGAEAGERDE